MSLFDIHISLLGLSVEGQEHIKSTISSVPVSYHLCQLNMSIADTPKMHVLLVGEEAFIENADANDVSNSEKGEDGLNNLDFDISPDSTEENSDRLGNFFQTVRKKSPHCAIYLLASREKILDLSEQQRSYFRDFILYPNDDVLLVKRINLIVSDLYDILVKKVKSTKLKTLLDNSYDELNTLKSSLNVSNESNKQSNKHLIRLLSNQVFARMGQRASGRNQQLNLLLVEVAKACDLNEQEIQDLTNGWHLRNVGKMGFNDHLLHTPYVNLSADEQRIFNTHPIKSHAALMIVRPLDKSAKIILQHKEKIDGSGYPHGIAGDDISIQAQILSVLNDYTELVAGRHSDRQFSTVDALEYLDHYATEKYNDDVVNKLMKILPELSNKGQGMHDLLLPSHQLKNGMQLTRDLISKEGILLLSEGLRLDNESISRLFEMEENLQEEFNLFIKQK